MILASSAATTNFWIVLARGQSCASAMALIRPESMSESRSEKLFNRLPCGGRADFFTVIAK